LPIFYQQQINESTRLGVWKIEETEDFFKGNVPQHRDVTHPHKRLQHLAGRFLLQYLYPDFPYELIQLADTRKPYLLNEKYHFSISHCGDYAAAIVSSRNRVGIDVEIPHPKVLSLRNKFLSVQEQEAFWQAGEDSDDLQTATLLWSCKEAVFKWYGNGGVDFKKDICLSPSGDKENIFHGAFTKTGDQLWLHHLTFHDLVLAWVVS
jgi:phosphopantetheinyl transferase